MANRPWVQPDEVRTYSEYPSVQKRRENKLEVDISRAEQYIISLTNNKFDECEKIPECVKTAVILIAEAYAYNAHIASIVKKSETIEDYSYTAADIKAIDIASLDIDSLLEGYTLPKARNGIIMRMRKL